MINFYGVLIACFLTTIVSIIASIIHVRLSDQDKNK
jgi:hypothetical protein